MDRNVAQLVDAIDEAIVCLRHVASPELWINWLSRDREWLLAGDLDAAVEHLQRAYGGMGSINDLVGITEGSDRQLKDALLAVYDTAEVLRRKRVLAR